MRLSRISLAFGWIFLIAFSSALSVDRTYPIPMVPLATTDAGTGVYAVAFNAPYQAVRQVVTLDNIISRVSFETIPQLPVGATLDSWSYTLRTPVSEFPSWLTFVSSWAGSADFALVFNGTDALTTGTDPQAFTFELRGSVFYTHGPSRFVEQEQRVVRVITHLHVWQSLSERSSIVTGYFSQGQSVNGVQPLTLRTPVNRIPSFTLEDNERYKFVCGGSLSDFTGACQWGDEGTSPSPIWASELSHIVVERGVLRIRAPLASWGAITVNEGAALVFDGVSNATSLALFGWTSAPQIAVNGTVAVQKGVMRLVGTTAVGTGTFIIGRGAVLEVDPRSAAVLLEQSEGRRVAVYNEGEFRVVSGEIVPGGAVISVGLGVVVVGMSARMVLTGKTGHVIGGVDTGSERLSDSPGVNELGLVLSGALHVESGTLRLGAAARVQGLGYMSVGPSSTLSVAIEWYSVDFPDAGVISSGPPAERPIAGFHVDGGTVKLIQGGLTLSSGILVEGKGTVDIGEHGFIRLSGAKSRNEFSGSWVTNAGDFMLLAGASVDFNTILTSTTHIRALDTASTIYFSSRAKSVMSRAPGTRVGKNGSGLAATPTHLFALYCAGSLVLRDGARLELTAEEPNAGVSSQLEPARFFSAAVFNSGYLTLTGAAKLEANTFEQRIESAATGISASKITEDSSGPIYSQPYTHLSSLASTVALVSDSRYRYDAGQGLIYEQDGATSARLLGISLGSIGGADGSKYSCGALVRASGRISPGAVYSTVAVRGDGAAAQSGVYAMQGSSVGLQSLSVEGGIVQVELVDTGSRLFYDQLLLTGPASLSGAVLHLATNLPVQVLAAADITALVNGRTATTTLPEAAHALAIATDPSAAADSARITAVSGKATGELFRIPIIVATKVLGQFSEVTAKRVTSTSAVQVNKGSAVPLHLRRGVSTLGDNHDRLRHPQDDAGEDDTSAGSSSTTSGTPHTMETFATPTTTASSSVPAAAPALASVNAAYTDADGSIASSPLRTRPLVTSRASIPAVRARTVSVALEYSSDGKTVYLVGYSGLANENSAAGAKNGTAVLSVVFTCFAVLVGMFWFRREQV